MDYERDSFKFRTNLRACNSSEEVKEGPIIRIDKDKPDFENYKEIAQDYKKTRILR